MVNGPFRFVNFTNLYALLERIDENSILISNYFQAEYHADSEEFELHSPSLTAFKWWPGGLGRTATHAVVMAQLTTQVS